MSRLKVWTQKDGTYILIEDMSLQHLKNTINMIENNYDGDIAAAEELCPEYLDLTEELIFRKFKKR